VGGWANTSFVNAVMLGDVVRVMFLFYLSPVWSVLGGWLFLKERIPPLRWAAVAGAGGSVAVLGGPGGQQRGWPSPGSMRSLTAGFAFAANNVIARAAQQVPMTQQDLRGVRGLRPAVAVAMSGLSGRELPVIGAWLWLALLGYGFGWMLLATATWQYGVTHLESSRAGVILLANCWCRWARRLHLVAKASARWSWAGGALITVAALAEALLPPADPANALTPPTATARTP
jgi:drug/metabolite transporter (DMT)-like permease